MWSAPPRCALRGPSFAVCFWFLAVSGACSTFARCAGSGGVGEWPAWVEAQCGGRTRDGCGRVPGECVGGAHFSWRAPRPCGCSSPVLLACLLLVGAVPFPTTRLRRWPPPCRRYQANLRRTRAWAGLCCLVAAPPWPLCSRLFSCSSSAPVSRQWSRRAGGWLGVRHCDGVGLVVW